MPRGKLLLKWKEPKAWLATAKAYAKSEGGTTVPWKAWASVLLLIAATQVWGWLQADPAQRVSPLGLVVLLAILFIVLHGFAWLIILVMTPTVTALYDRGILHGARFSRRWIPYENIESFCLEEDQFEGRHFRFLAWRESNREEESHSVLPDDIDVNRIVSIFSSKSIEMREDPDRA